MIRIDGHPMKRPDILIQNVSAQCIPNLVAARTFRPRKMIWVYTPQFGETQNRLRDLTLRDSPDQENWRVDARDVESMHGILRERFAALAASGDVIYHLTGGTKSMALQGLYNHGTFRRQRSAKVMGVVMDPCTQHFDVIYPQPVNNAIACASLSLDDMLAVHGNSWDKFHPHDKLKACAQSRELWEDMRAQAPAMKKAWRVNDMRALHQRPPKDNQRHFSYPCSFPEAFRQTLALLQKHGWLSELHYPADDQVCYKQHRRDIIKLINGGWLECWLGATLYDSGINWHGARVSAKFNEGKGGSQELDFLGATDKNHLVYWSCKTEAKLTNDKLFEVDALRDGIAGSDFHVAGLLHTAHMQPTMQAKAKRMHLHVVQAFAPDAAEQVLRISAT